jgi:EAL domain-containing protein (putative c-di-GMP-specific phosphodiesterase class I)
LKIDGSFVRDITTDADDAAIVDAIMALASSLNLNVVAEGVEIQEQLNYLSERGCDFAQGYFFSKPLVQSDFEAFIGRTIPPTGT